MKPDDEAKVQIVKNLSACETAPVTLNDSQRALLSESFVGTRSLFASADFEDIWTLFQFCHALADIARLLHERGVDECLSMTDYQYFAEDGTEYFCLLTLVLQRLDADAVGKFLSHWQENNCALSELRHMERRVPAIDAREFDIALVSYTGYVKLIYGSRFKTISLGKLADWQRKEFGHIRDIQAEDAAQMLAHLDQLRPLLLSIRCRADVMLVLRSLEHLDRFDSVEALKAELLEVDQDWKDLADVMELSPDFKERHQEDIVKFLCRDGTGPGLPRRTWTVWIRNCTRRSTEW